MDFGETKSPEWKLGALEKSGVKPVRVYPSPKPGLIMIAMIMLDDAELNIRSFNTIESG
jgi:hypothetical protein